MAKKKAAVKGKETLTEAVLRLYDKGIHSPSAILAELMMTFPALTRHSIGNIISIHRPPKPVVVQKPAAPKLRSERAILEEVMLHKCATCWRHTSGIPCVAPSSACPYPEMDEDWKRLKELTLKEQEKSNKNKKKRGDPAPGRRMRMRGKNIFDILEEEIEYRNNHKTKQSEDGEQMEPDDESPLSAFEIAGASSFMGIEMPGFVDDTDGILFGPTEEDEPVVEDALTVMTNMDALMKRPSFDDDEDENDNDDSELDDMTEVESGVTVEDVRAVLADSFFI